MGGVKKEGKYQGTKQGRETGVGPDMGLSAMAGGGYDTCVRVKGKTYMQHKWFQSCGLHMRNRNSRSQP